MEGRLIKNKEYFCNDSVFTSIYEFMNLLKILLTIYTKRIYNTSEGQKHFVLCDETPAFCHFFYLKLSENSYL